jgi:hypothetical protein
MKDVLRLITILIGFLGLLAFLSSCAKNGRVYNGIAQGIYEGTYQTQEMTKDEPTIAPGNEHPSYDQYRREKKEMMKDKNN